MASSGVLYMKGMNGMESDDDMEEEEDVWDDRKLNAAYDKALKMASLEVAKRVAMSTNSGDRKKEKSGELPFKQPKNPKQNKKSKKSKAQQAQRKESVPTWKEGMPCRAMYSADGFDYEATLLTILDDGNCVIRYLGYNNTEIVPVSSLQPTLGKQARRDQMLEALAANEDASSTHSTFTGNEFSEDSRVKESPSSSKYRASRNKRPDLVDGFPMPNMPMPNMPMPDVSTMMREFGQMDMPIPPPPLVGLQGAQSCSDEEALSNMLVSWYMSGYYTGLYQGMKRLKQRHRDC